MGFRSQIFGIALFEIALFPGTVLAQTTPPTPAVTSSDEGLAEIVVTAEKRSQNLQRSPVAITDMSGDDLVRLGLNDIASASILVPSVAFTFISSELHLYIRGIGAEQDRVSIDQLVSYSIDGVNIPHEITGNNFFDVHDVEVLPGPQSTLYGNGGAGGAVVIANNRPKTDNFEISTLLEAGNYGFGHNTSVINVPLSANFAVRAAVDYARHDGYYAEGADSENQVATRLSALYTQGAFTGYAWYSFDNNAGEPPSFITLIANHTFETPGNPWTNYSCTPTGVGVPLGANPSCDPQYIGAPSQSAHASIGGADLNVQFDGFKASLTPSYVSDSVNILQYFGPFPNEQHITTRQDSAEFKLVSDTNLPLTWLGGLYWNKQNSHQFFNVNGSAGNPLVWNNENTYAAFGQATYAIVPSIRATVGLRYSSNEKDGHGCNCSAANNEGIYFNSRNTTPHVDWKAGIEADIAPHSMVYATIQTGYTNGSYQYFNNTGLLGAQNEGTAPLIRPTELLAYTVGSKNRFFDNRLEVNDEAYYYNYKDLLIAAFSANPLTFGNTFFNAHLVEIYGDQLDVKYHVTANDQLQANVGYLHARAIDFVVGDPAFNYGGFELPESPDMTATLRYLHTFNLRGGASAVFSADSHYENGYWNTFQHNPTTHQPAFTESDISVTYYSSGGNWNVGAWVKNVENSAVVSIGAYIGAGIAQGIGDLNPPRTFGLRGAWYFGTPR
jgi:iron complex outermembrane receptor protein